MPGIQDKDWTDFLPHDAYNGNTGNRNGVIGLLNLTDYSN